MNKNYPLTGNVDVVFRAYSSYTLNGRSYEVDEPVAYIKNTEVTLNYGGFTKESSSVRTLTSFTDTAPESVTVEANVFKDAILKMFSETINDENITASKLVYVMSEEDGTVLLSDSNIQNVFIYDENMNKQSGYTVDTASGLISNLQADTYYYIDYGIIKTNYQGFGLKTVSLPYLTIELKGTTMIDGAAKNFLFKIPRAQLDMAPSFIFRTGEFATTSIRFKIISNRQDSGVDLYFY